MTAQLAWGSVVSRLTWWLWVPALSPPWAAAYPPEADLDLDHSGNRPVINNHTFATLFSFIGENL